MGLAGDLLLSENPSLRTDSAAVPCVHMFFKHAHDDHICDAFTLVRLYCATLVAIYELADPFAAQGVPAPDLMPGSGVDLQRGLIQMMATFHRSPSHSAAAKSGPAVSSGAPGLKCRRMLYHAGDTMGPKVPSRPTAPRRSSSLACQWTFTWTRRFGCLRPESGKNPHPKPFVGWCFRLPFGPVLGLLAA